MAVATGISPVALMECDYEVFEEIVRLLANPDDDGTADPKMAAKYARLAEIRSRSGR